MILAELREISKENKVHDLRALLSDKPSIVIGRKNNFSAGQSDIILGEDKYGKPRTEEFAIFGVSRRQAVISYENGKYYLQDFSEHGTTIMNNQRLGKGEKRVLENGVKLFFGRNRYGPVEFWQDFPENSGQI